MCTRECKATQLMHWEPPPGAVALHLGCLVCVQQQGHTTYINSRERQSSCVLQPMTYLGITYLSTYHSKPDQDMF